MSEITREYLNYIGFRPVWNSRKEFDLTAAFAWSRTLEGEGFWARGKQRQTHPRRQSKAKIDEMIRVWEGREATADDETIDALKARIAVLEEALRGIVSNWDANRFGPKECENETEDGTKYWSPSQSMINSEFIAAARRALEARHD